MANKSLAQAIDYELVAKLAAYYEAQSKIRYRLAETIYRDSCAMLGVWADFMAEFGEGGQFDGLQEQLAADAATGITQEEIALLQGCLAMIVETMQTIERRSPGMFAIPIPVPPAPEPEPEPKPEPEA
jgi:hypothetical protein